MALGPIWSVAILNKFSTIWLPTQLVLLCWNQARLRYSTTMYQESLLTRKKMQLAVYFSVENIMGSCLCVRKTSPLLSAIFNSQLMMKKQQDISILTIPKCFADRSERAAGRYVVFWHCKKVSFTKKIVSQNADEMFNNVLRTLTSLKFSSSCSLD